jgi:hypothetical protein
MKPKRIKAALVDTYEDARFEERRWVGEAWQLPADAESYERMVEQMAREIHKNCRRYEPHLRTWKNTWEQVRAAYRLDAKSALKAIGITQPKKGTQ